MTSGIKYAWFNNETPREEGFSKELISSNFLDYKDMTNINELECWVDPQLDTIYKGLMKNYKSIPDHQCLGTLVNGKYVWKSFKDSVDDARYFGSGCQALGLIPEVEAEGKTWRFMGI